MSPRRATSTPPDLPGFDYLDLLGSGGFADVFLYEQHLPRRRVAVKVLLPDAIGTDAVAGFTHEANVMAQLATHPSIVSIHQAGLASDGRPYLVMEYCSRPNLQVRHRKERFSEAETLRIGIQIAGAVETAHRAGILHRDIKPANVLVTDYGRPALTDFGIASAATSEVESAGMSVPWSPAETFGAEPASTVRSDVYALAATLFTLLAGRSPFEVPGGSNSTVDLIRRIQQGHAPRVDRADVSDALEHVLATALAHDPAVRPASAMEFARALQRVQIGHGLQPTVVDVIEETVDEPRLEEDDDGDGPTRIRGLVSIAAQATVPDDVERTVRRAPAPARLAVPEAPPVPDTRRRPTTVVAGAPVSAPAGSAPAGAAAGSAPAGPSRPGRGRRVGLVAGIVAVVVVGGGGVIASTSAGHPSVSSSTPAAAQPEDPAGQTVPDVTGVTGVASAAGVTFTWTNPAPATGDHYQWRTITSTGETGPFTPATTAAATVPQAAAGATCIQVQLVRASGTASPDPVQGCAP